MQMIRTLLLLFAAFSSFAGENEGPARIFSLYRDAIEAGKVDPFNHLVLMDLQEFPKQTGTIFVFGGEGTVRVFVLRDGLLFPRKVNGNFRYKIQDLRKRFLASIDNGKITSRTLAIDADYFAFISRNSDNFLLCAMRENQKGFVKILEELEKQLSFEEPG